MTPTRIDVTCWKKAGGCGALPGNDCVIMTGPFKGRARGKMGLHVVRGEVLNLVFIQGWNPGFTAGAASRQPEVDGLRAELTEAVTAVDKANGDVFAAQEAVTAARKEIADTKLLLGTSQTMLAELRQQVAALEAYKAAHPDAVGVWSPAQLGFTTRPSGPGYIRLEDIPGVGDNLRLAAAHQAADGKVITLPGRQFWLKDFDQTAGADPKWAHGLLVHSTVGKYHCRGFVGSGADTIISMVPMSSHFTETNGRQGTLGTTQQPQNTILFYGVADVEFGNLVLQGTQQPHYYHGFRSTGPRTHVHHLKTMGAAQGGQNSPPGETYSCAVGGLTPIIEDCEFDGRRVVGGPPISSTIVATLAATDAVVRRCHMHDMTSGFGVVQWAGSGLTTEDMWVSRPGTGTGGWNGAHTNHEIGTGKIRHIRPHILLDGYWGKPRRKTFDGTKEVLAKFPHFIFLAGTDSHTDPELYKDVEIIDPVYDQWGATPGGFAVMLDEVAMRASKKPKVTINGQILTGVVRPSWWLESTAPKTAPIAGIDTTKQYWISANTGDGSVWG